MKDEGACWHTPSVLTHKGVILLLLLCWFLVYLVPGDIFRGNTECHKGDPF